MTNVHLYIYISKNYKKRNKLDRAIISTKTETSKHIVKEARKKAIDQGMTFSDAVIRLLEKWVNNEVQIENEVRK